MNFKEALAQDIHNTFVNENEFAEFARINFVKMLIVPGGDAMKEFNSEKKTAEHVKVFSVSAHYFEHKPKPEKLMNFDDEDYRIVSCDDELGMYTITLERVRA